MVKSEVFSYTVGGNVNLCKYYGKQYGSATKKLKIQLPYNPTILFLGVTPDKTIIQKGTHTSMFIAVLFTITKTYVVVVESLSRAQLFGTPWTATHQASLSFTISQNN